MSKEPSNPSDKREDFLIVKEILIGNVNDIKEIVSQGRKTKDDPAEYDIFMTMQDELESLYINFKSNWQNAVGLHVKLGTTDKFPDVEFSRLQNAAKKYYFESRNYFAQIHKTLDAASKTVNDSTLNTSKHNNSSDFSHLPNITLPRFSGNIQEWKSFHDVFKSVVHDDPDLPVIRKFHLLKLSIEGEAASVIQTFPLTEDNYQVAWSALDNAYNNKRVLASHYINNILDYKPVSSKTPVESLQHFISNVIDNISAYSLLKVPNSEDYLFFQLAIRNLDTRTRESFEIKHTGDKFPSYKTFSQFVRDRHLALKLSRDDCSSRVVTNTSPASRSYQGHKGQRVLLAPACGTSDTQASSGNNFGKSHNKTIICHHCQQNHRLDRCSLFSHLDPEKRFQIVKKLKLCTNCLSKFHISANCTSTFACRKCGGRHHTMLHFRDENQHTPVKPGSSSANGSAPAGSVLSSVSLPSNQVLLGTAIVRMRSASGHLIPVRAVLDGGSHFNIMTDKCLRRLGLKSSNYTGRVGTLGDGQHPGNKRKVTCSILSASSYWNVNFVVIAGIANSLPTAELSQSLREKYKQFNLADQQFWKVGPVDCLIGAEWFYRSIIGVPQVIVEGFPLVVPTVFGHVIAGSMIDTFNTQPPFVGSTLFTHEFDPDILTNFWRLEEPSTSQEDSGESPNSLCEQHFKESHYRTETGQYVVSLPFRIKPPVLTDSHGISLRRFTRLESRFTKDRLLAAEYKDFMSEYESLGHMVIAKQPAKFVIPHHAVFKTLGHTRKIRVVFDGSCKAMQGSLNSYLHVGAKLHRDIQDILSNFRIHRFALTTDIVKMFRNILVDPKDRVYQNILWRSSSHKPIKLYELTTLVFGLASSPHDAIRVLIQLVEDEGSLFPLASRAILEDFYVDDGVTGAETLDEASKLKDELITLLAKGGFSLSKWASNDPRLVSNSDLNDPVSLDSGENGFVKILGMQWIPSEDIFCYSIQLPEVVPTKRSILSAISRIYDPLGFLAPSVFLVKTLIQELWKLKIDWDTPVVGCIASTWQAWLSGLPSLTTINIPRFLSISKDSTYDVVGFADASQKGYAAVCYLRVLHSDGSVQVFLLKSKTKLSPLNNVTINRLELCAALLLTRVLSSLKLLLNKINISSINLFSDSSVVLSWLKRSPHELKTFVANRVTQIIQDSKDACWLHVRSEDNAADCGSRGVMPNRLHDHPLWWHGPSWLQQPISDWPKSDLYLETQLPEMKPHLSYSLAIFVSKDIIDLLNDHSCLPRLLRIISYLKRFKQVSTRKQKFTNKIISATECHESLLLLCRITQKYHWNEFIHERKLVKRDLTSLSPFHHAPTDLFLVGGRLDHSDIAESAKHPILLPPESRLARLIVDDTHLKYFHAGPRLLRALINQKFWIPSIGRLIRQRLFQCKVCYTLKKSVNVPFMSDLPKPRVNPSRPFTHVGIDFGGPFTIRDTLRRKFLTTKSYLCLFVCLSTKAVHLEVTSSLSTDAFLAALNRFVARRGRPSNIYSDCGRNFIGADRQLKDIYTWFHSKDSQTRIGSFMAKEQITWQFNPPYTPHFGGLWEAAIKQAKHILIKVTKDTPFTFEEIATIFAQVEAMLNSRPLCPLTDDIDSLDCLTPGHFLIGAPLMSVPDKSLLHLKENHLSRWQMIKQRTQRFWRRWTQEYLPTLQHRMKWQQERPNLVPGDLVLLKEDSPPLQWPLGRVIAAHPGKDDRVRVVTLKTATGDYVRPVSGIVSLRHIVEPST